MYKYYIVWCYIDEIGRHKAREVKWFVDKAEASAWKQKMKRGNGSYFCVIEEKYGDYNLYQQMLLAQQEYYRLVEKFYGGGLPC